MKIYRAFYPKGNMVNRQYKAYKNIRNFFFGMSISQCLLELTSVALGNHVHPINLTSASLNTSLGCMSEFSKRSLENDYYKILHRAIKMECLKDARLRHTNSAAEKVKRLLANA